MFRWINLFCGYFFVAYWGLSNTAGCKSKHSFSSYSVRNTIEQMVCLCSQTDSHCANKGVSHWPAVFIMHWTTENGLFLSGFPHNSVTLFIQRSLWLLLLVPLLPEVLKSDLLGEKNPGNDAVLSCRCTCGIWLISTNSGDYYVKFPVNDSQ